MLLILVFVSCSHCYCLCYFVNNLVNLVSVVSTLTVLAVLHFGVRVLHIEIKTEMGNYKDEHC